ncbi:MAG: CPBP family intramembrane metalloprotease, partial [Clostridia bacterium]|nr:CPBP family intramembrane metalloprotease [Clostridia bacterium]
FFTESQMQVFLDDVFTGTNIWIYSASVVVAAPIVEELFFRKLLISRMERHGEKAAILMSGLIFGIFHGNFSQFFYAFALGIVLGYIYIRTRKIGITIALHMLVNLLGGVLAPLAVQNSILLMTLVSLGVIGIAIAGLVLFILQIRKVSLVKRPTQMLGSHWGEYAFVNTGMILFLVAGVILFVTNTLVSLV